MDCACQSEEKMGWLLNVEVKKNLHNVLILPEKSNVDNFKFCYFYI